MDDEPAPPNLVVSVEGRNLNEPWSLLASRDGRWANPAETYLSAREDLPGYAASAASIAGQLLGERPGDVRPLYFRITIRHKLTGRLLALLHRHWSYERGVYELTGEDYVEDPDAPLT
ncbi:hypothetical protein [Kitasatospora purpeofusca]|uniref:hypothetical protein n=1 Tax=Kitasatospora purpeofusca TaxID=67352 RepID=UPI00369E99A4